MRATACFTAILSSALLVSRVAAQVADIDGASLVAGALGAVVERADCMTVLQVAKVNRENRVITFKKVADLKGEESATTVHHNFAADIPAHRWRQVLAWAQPGKTAICFRDENYSHTCVGNYWYRSGAVARAVWSTRWLDDDDTDTYAGPVEQLREHVTAILAGKEVVITATARLRGGLFDDEQTPIVRDWLHGKKGRIWRVKASLKLIDNNAIDRCPGGYFVGWGVGGKEAVPGLVAALKHDEARVRSEAAEDLGQIGAGAKPALPALRTALADEDGHVRVFAAEALWRIDPDNKQTLPALLQALGSKQPGVSAAAVTALVGMGPPARRAVPQLVAILREEGDAYARAVSAFALGRLAPEDENPAGPRRDVVTALGKALRQDKDEDVRRWSAAALRKFGPDAKPALPDLRAALKDKSIAVAGSAAEVLSRLGHDGSAALAEALGEKGGPARRFIADLLADFGPHSKDLVPALRKALDDADPDVRWGAAWALVRIDPGTGARFGVPVLARLAADKDYEFREYVLEFLAEIGPEARAAVPTLIEILKGKEKAMFRWRAAEALGAVGPEARSAVPALIESLDSDKFRVVSSAVVALGKIGPDARAAQPALRAKLAREKGTMGRVRLAVALVRVGAKGEAAAVLADEGRNGKDRWYRENALRALGEMGPAAATVLPALKKALRDEDDLMRHWVAFAAWRIGRRVQSGDKILEERQEAIEALTELIHKPDRRLGLEGVIKVVELLGPDASPLVPALLAVLKDEKRRDRGTVLRALAAMGPAGAEAVPVLEAMLKDDPKQVTVALTLARLGRRDLAARAVPSLVKWAEAGWEERRHDLRSILDDIETLGREAKPAVPFLLRVMRHDNRDLYVRAARVLVAIDPEAAKKAGVDDAPRESQSCQTGIGRDDDD